MSEEDNGGIDPNIIIEKRKLECYQNATDTSNKEGLFCPTWFDGWSCWPETPAGQIANQSCPSFVAGFEPNSKLNQHR
ncbi:hypothetical protein GWI33_000120 [Rhynchophorus ferrugineus]|uniref:G-protein coupled receptors family 2 profile 1 domain-containing protein n=1 Tax=Rhynchophorus ferrugineus TaxID=354439 RepID=A0A834IXI6_RHYFE|nr:hypothetical protein GWI33_000120 [Rhynchophorus ferrugineus]